MVSARLAGLVLAVMVLGCGNVREEPIDATGGDDGVTDAPGGDGPGGGGDAGCDPGAVERCNGLDDDCDTMIDEDFAGLGSPCDGVDGDACTEGMIVCAADELSVTCDDATGDNAELCNSLDDNCDGVGDNVEFMLGADCDGSDGDQCMDGTRVCDEAMQGAACFDPGPDLVETCNGIDDDCDNTTDEATCAAGLRCNGASCVCDSTSGCSGCCANNQCRPGTSAQQCGVNGQACFSCGIQSSHCENGQCRCGNGTPCSPLSVCCSAGPGEFKFCVSQGQLCP